MMQLTDTIGAKCMSAMHKDTRDALTNIILEATELTDVEAT